MSSLSSVKSARAICCLNPLDDPNWDAKLERLPAATFFHTSAWARVLQDTYGFSPVYFTVEGSQGLEAVLPLMEINSWLTGRRGVSLPFTDACAPLCADATTFQPLFDATRAHARERHWKYLELRGGQELLPSAPPAVSFWGHTLDLRQTDSSLFARFDSSVRRAVRKAEQSELTVEICHTREAIQDFYRLLCLTRKRLGVPAQPFRFFEAIYRHIIAAQKGCVVLCRKGNIAIAGALFLHFQRSALYKFAGSDDNYQSLRPSNLVIWRAIQWHLEHGFEGFDFGRTSIGNEGLRRFKLSWSTEEHLINYIRYNPARNHFETQKDQSSGWHNRVFRLLPIAASRLIGLVLYKHSA